jgi:hypothetical protein
MVLLCLYLMVKQVEIMLTRRNMQRLRVIVETLF